MALLINEVATISLETGLDISGSVVRDGVGFLVVGGVVGFVVSAGVWGGFVGSVAVCFGFSEKYAVIVPGPLIVA